MGRNELFWVFGDLSFPRENIWHIMKKLEFPLYAALEEAPRGGTQSRNHADFFVFTHSRIERKKGSFTQYRKNLIENG